MTEFDEIKKEIINIKSEQNFNQLALAIFQIHRTKNPIYKQFVDSLPIRFRKPENYKSIPFLPIEFFKSNRIIIDGCEPEIIFESSGTSGQERSKHYVSDRSWYIENSLRNFKHFYGDLNDYCVLALLPSYLEREGSSLVLMAEKMIEKSGHPLSGFYLDDFALLEQHLLKLKDEGQKTILIGVSFALLEFSEMKSLKFPELIVMETGGMKGRRKEMIREELHHELKKGFGVECIHSEYGMTELLSQGYSKGKGVFQSPPWMKFLIRDSNDPLTLLDYNQTGGINVIDLANIYSCPFIATQDLGRQSKLGTEILGRFDNSDIRGCNLLVI